MALPLLNEVSDIVIDDIPCDGVPGMVMKAVAAWQQGPLFLTQLEQQLVSKFKNDVGPAFAGYGKAVQKEVQQALDDLMGVDSFQRFLAEFSKNNFFDKLFDPFAPILDAQPLHQDSFSLFGANTASTGEISADSSGSGAEVSPDQCSGVVSTGLASGPVTTTADSRAKMRDFRRKMSAAGKVMGMAATLAATPELMVDTLVVTANDVLQFFTQASVSVKSLRGSADKIYTALKGIRTEDYARKHDLTAFAILMDQLIAASSDASTALRNRAPAARLEELDEAVDAAIAKASNWICAAGGLDAFYQAQSVTLGQILLIEQQTLMLEALAGRCTVRLSNMVKSINGLTTSAAGLAPTVYYENIFTTISCQAKRIRNELSTFNQQKTQDFFMRRMQWCVALQSMRLMVEKFSVKQYKTRVQQALAAPAGSAMAGFTLQIDTADLEALEAAVEQVIDATRTFNRIARTKLRADISMTVVDGAHTALGTALDAYETAQRVFTDKLSAVFGVTDVAAAQTAGKAFMVALAAVPVLLPLIDAMRSGDYSKLMSTDALSDSLSGVLAKLLAKAQECCDNSGATDGRSRTGSRRLNDMQRQSADDDRRTALDTLFFEDVGSASGINAKLDLRRIKAEVRDITQLMRIPCLGGVSVPLPPVL